MGKINLMDKKTLFWILLFSVLAIAAAGAFFALKNTGAAELEAQIYLDGELLRTIDLNAVAVPYEFTVETERGVNTVYVEHGAISVRSADCPDQICVRQGRISDSLVPIVCLPHRLVIQIQGAD